MGAGQCKSVASHVSRGVDDEQRQLVAAQYSQHFRHLRRVATLSYQGTQCCEFSLSLVSKCSPSHMKSSDSCQVSQSAPTASCAGPAGKH